ncbi:hypothetical protein ACFS32_00910 [Novosphingobium pokkalii]|uniref:hypothetical protein n=1 Tax=Novosphingobium pokkalii TaxID=1770194 RepID=UPI0036398DB0
MPNLAQLSAQSGAGNRLASPLRHQRHEQAAPGGAVGAIGAGDVAAQFGGPLQDRGIAGRAGYFGGVEQGQSFTHHAGQGCRSASQR